MKIYRREKKGNRIYVLGVKIYEETQSGCWKKKYLFGVRLHKKKIVLPASCDEGLINSYEQKILTLGLYYRDYPAEQRPVLCFDSLSSPFAEAIDAWTMFQYLQSKGIYSIYVLNSGNTLYTKLKETNSLKDVIIVDNEWDFLKNHSDIIAKSRIVLSSFGFYISKIFKILPNCRYVFIDHGVMFLRDNAIDLYGENGLCAANEILASTRLTKQIYDNAGSWQGKMICCGLPRWDNFQHGQKNKSVYKIFVFFTWRSGFYEDSSKTDIYLNRIEVFLEELGTLANNNSNVEIYFSYHHALHTFVKQIPMHHIANINFIKTTEISEMIKSADLFITDFSSMVFDFMHRQVPTVFYSFDSDIVYGNAKDQPSLMAEKIDRTLGKCYRNSKDVIHTIQEYLEHACELTPEDKDRNDKIFWNKRNNCERLWNLLMKNT